MNAAREQILAAVRAATRDMAGAEVSGSAADPPCPATAAPPDGTDLGARFLARAADLGAKTAAVAAPAAAVAIAAGLARHGVERLLVPVDLPTEWLPAHPRAIRVDGCTTPAEIDRAEAVLTGCALAVAETGTFALDGGVAQGRRALTLLPDLHVCVVREDQLVADVQTAFSRLGETVARSGAPMTLVSGPSATSDIELERIVGVHGPRRLELILICGSVERTEMLASAGAILNAEFEE